MEKWIFDSSDFPGEVFRQFIKDCYQGNKLIKNQLTVGGKRVDLNNLTMPLLNIYGKFDHLAPPEADSQLVNHVGSEETQDICLDTGHIGIYVSSKYQEVFAPKIATWLKKRDKRPIKNKLDPSKAAQLTKSSNKTAQHQIRSAQGSFESVCIKGSEIKAERQVVNG